jgi:hypothetical protein
MGTITRTFANNITTSGVFKPTAFNDASFDNVTAVPEGALPAGGSMVLLSTQTASGDASISFTTGIDSTYKEYMFIFNDIHVSTNDAYFQFNLSTDGGSTYDVTKTTSFFKAAETEGNSDFFFNYETGQDLAQSTSYQRISIAISDNADASCAGTLNLFNPSDTTYVKHFIANTHNEQGGSIATNNFIAGYGNTTSAVNAISFQVNTGTFDGTIQMFGIL